MNTFIVLVSILLIGLTSPEDDSSFLEVSNAFGTSKFGFSAFGKSTPREMNANKSRGHFSGNGNQLRLYAFVNCKLHKGKSDIYLGVNSLDNLKVAI